MKDCIFCKIVSGEMPYYKVYENENFLAFLDIYPRVKGHTLVIPKKHYHWVYDVPEFGEYWESVLEVTRKIQRSLMPKLINYFTYGIDVSHAHIHVLPRFTETEFLPKTINLSKTEMTEIAEKINSAS